MHMWGVGGLWGWPGPTLWHCLALKTGGRKNEDRNEDRLVSHAQPTFVCGCAVLCCRRLAPLVVQPEALSGLHQIQDGDCVVAVSCGVPCIII